MPRPPYTVQDVHEGLLRFRQGQSARTASGPVQSTRTQWLRGASSEYGSGPPPPMSLRLADLQDRFRATVVGFAVGDALGFPFRGLPAQSAARSRGMAEDFAQRPRGRFARGQFSDDTQVLLAVAEAVARERRIDGRHVAAQVAELWREGVILQPAASTTEAARALLEGTPWMSSGAPIGVRDAACLSRGVVAGLWCEESPPRLSHGAQVLTISTHKDPVCVAAVAAVGRAIQLGFTSQELSATAFCEQLSQAAVGSDPGLADELYYLPRVLTWDVERALSALRCVGVPPSQLTAEPGLPAHVTPVLLTALYAVLKAPTDFREALTMVLHRGGEVDVAAGLAGAMLGARLGTEGLPARLRKNVLYAEALMETADRLFDARLAHEPVAAQAWAVVMARR